MLQHTITGWPGGKPNTQMTLAIDLKEQILLKKRVILLSPHPDDDVISMGGTFFSKQRTLLSHQTSTLALYFDDEALKFAEVCNDFVEIDATKINLNCRYRFLE
jgi:glucosamine-6-phosphate deaminase